MGKPYVCHMSDIWVTHMTPIWVVGCKPHEIPQVYHIVFLCGYHMVHTCGLPVWNPYGQTICMPHEWHMAHPCDTHMGGRVQTTWNTICMPHEFPYGTHIGSIWHCYWGSSSAGPISLCTSTCSSKVRTPGGRISKASDSDDASAAASDALTLDIQNNNKDCFSFLVAGGIIVTQCTPSQWFKCYCFERTVSSMPGL